MEKKFKIAGYNIIVSEYSILPNTVIFTVKKKGNCAEINVHIIEDKAEFGKLYETYERRGIGLTKGLDVMRYVIEYYLEKKGIKTIYGHTKEKLAKALSKMGYKVTNEVTNYRIEKEITKNNNPLPLILKKKTKETQLKKKLFIARIFRKNRVI